MDIPFIISLESAKKIVTPKFIEELEIEWSRTFFSIEAVKRSFQAKLDNINKDNFCLIFILNCQFWPG